MNEQIPISWVVVNCSFEVLNPRSSAVSPLTTSSFEMKNKQTYVFSTKKEHTRNLYITWSEPQRRKLKEKGVGAKSGMEFAKEWLE